MGSDGRATISVGVPVYNGERYLEEALTSITGQTRLPDEAMVFDNCSTDRSAEIARALLGDDAVRVAPRNLGAVVNFNRAVRETSGDYFAWLAADDRFASRFLDVAAAALDAHPGAPACLPAIQFIDPEGRPHAQQHDLALASRDPGVRLRSFLRRSRWTESYCLYRREALLASPMFADAYGADVLLTWWFVLRGPLLTLDEALYEYRTYPVKDADEVAAGLNPSTRGRQWRMASLWLNLRRATFDPGVHPEVARIARAELSTALLHRNWIKHLVWDCWLRAQAVTGFGWTRHLNPWRWSHR